MRGHQPTGLLREVHEDGAGLEHGEIVGVAIDDDRNAAVRVDGQELRLPLISGAEVDCVDTVAQAELLARDRSFPAVRRGSRVQIDHERIASTIAVPTGSSISSSVVSVSIATMR